MKQYTKLKLNEKQFDLLVEVLNKNNFEKLANSLLTYSKVEKDSVTCFLFDNEVSDIVRFLLKDRDGYLGFIPEKSYVEIAKNGK